MKVEDKTKEQLVSELVQMRQRIAELEEEELESLKVKDFKWVEADEFSQYPFPPADAASMDDFQLFTSSSKPKKPPSA